MLDQFGRECFGRLIFDTTGKSVGLKGLSRDPRRHRLTGLRYLYVRWVCSASKSATWSSHCTKHTHTHNTDMQTPARHRYLDSPVDTFSRSSQLSKPTPNQTSSVQLDLLGTRIKFGERSFSYAGPSVRNSLPHHVREITDSTRFKRQLKTVLFQRAYLDF